MKFFNVVVFIFFVWLAHVLFLLISHGTDSKLSGRKEDEHSFKHNILSQAREDSKIAEKLLVSFDTVSHNEVSLPSLQQQHQASPGSVLERSSQVLALEAIQKSLNEQRQTNEITENRLPGNKFFILYHNLSLPKKIKNSCDLCL